MHFHPYPFEQLDTLLDSIVPNTEYPPLSLTIGEPQFETPALLQEALCDSVKWLKKYPKSSGESCLKDAQKMFVHRRFSVVLHNDQLIPTLGTREVLFHFPHCFLSQKQQPKIVFPNPFYQIYEGAAIVSRAKIGHLALTQQNAFKPNPSDPVLANADLVILNFPNNPTGSSLTLDELCEWVASSQKYGFVLLNDECYSEIYTHTKPPSLLEASLKMGNHDFTNILVVNSLSKRSSAPGLRSGFIAGDANILSHYMRYRTYTGCAIPLPLQMAAAVAWKDNHHAESIRLRYANNLTLAQEILNIDVPYSTFYIWLQVNDDLVFAKRLYQDYNLKVLPGSFLGRMGAGRGFVRIALVEEEHKTKHALTSLHQCIKES
jgi:N-succinyldiaminopimelate aminotransferase